MNRLIATFFYVGYLKPAPGTWGSLAGLVAGWLLDLIGGPVLLAAAGVALFVAGLRATEAETSGKDDHDPSEIVVDEVVGQWIALFPTSLGAWATGHAMIDLWPGMVTAFVFFRLFDIWKPWLVGRADRRGDAMGVMLDDVLAGVFAVVTVGVLAAVSHLVIMRFV